MDCTLLQKSRQEEAIRLGRKDRHHKQHISSFEKSADNHSSTQYTGWNTRRLFEPMAFHNRMYLGDELERPHKNELTNDTFL